MKKNLKKDDRRQAKKLVKDLLRKDLYEGCRDQAHIVQENCPSYLYHMKAIFQQNYKKTVEAFITVNKIGDEVLLQWVKDGKLPISYK